MYVTRYCSRCLTTFHEDADRCPSLACVTARPSDGWGELLADGALIDRTYRVQRRLAIGGAGVTYLAREMDAQGEETGPHLAVKVLYAQRDTGAYLRRLATEAQILQGLKHAHIVECRGFVHRAGHSPYLVTRFEAGGSLHDHISRVGPLKPRVAAHVARQLCWALSVAHAQGVVHRDLKPENVLLTRQVGAEEVPELRVADFGIAKVSGSVGGMTRAGAFVGTPSYAAPEQFLGLPPEPATDTYALGGVFIFCLTGRTLLTHAEDMDPEDLHDRVLEALPPKVPEVADHLRGACEALLADIMAEDPRARIPLAEVESRLGQIAEGRTVMPGILVDDAEAGSPLRPFTRGGEITPRRDATVLPEDFTEARPIRSGATASGSTATPPPPSVSTPATPTVTTPTSAPPPVPPPSQAQPASPPAAQPPPRAPAPPQAQADSQTRPSGGGASKGPLIALGLVGLLLLGGAGAAAWSFLGGEAPLISGADTDPAAQAEWQAIGGDLGQRGPAAAQACNAPPQPQLEVRVAEDGALLGVTVHNAEDPALASCIAGQLAAQRFPRAGTGEVRVAVTLP